MTLSNQTLTPTESINNYTDKNKLISKILKIINNQQKYQKYTGGVVCAINNDKRGSTGLLLLCFEETSVKWSEILR